MAKFALNMSALKVKTIDTDKRSITSASVVRPTREIIAQMNEQARQAAWQGVLQTIADMHNKPVEAKGANWDVNDDEAARAIRVNYNLIQPDYFPERKTLKMDKQGSRELWTQIFQMKYGETKTETVDGEKTEVPNLPNFSDDSEESDKD